jgi:drug/metabolite transporter (DMT)-like permease
MLVAGPVLLLLSTLAGEPSRIRLEALNPMAIAALVHLTVVGTLAGFCVYIWLVRHADPVAATSYAYVNPVVAMILGAVILHEPMSPTMVLGGALVLLSVAAMLTTARLRRRVASRSAHPASTPLSATAG